MILVAALAAGFGYLSWKGRAIVEENLTKAFQRPVKIGEVKAVPPFGLSIDSLDIAGTFHSGRVSLQFNLPFLHNQDLMLAKVELHDPVFNIRRSPEGQLFLGDRLLSQQSTASLEEAAVLTVSSSAMALSSTIPAPTLESSIPAAGVIIDRLVIRNGLIHFENQQQGNELKLSLEQVRLEAAHFIYPTRPMATTFKLSALIVGEKLPFSGNQTQAQGWINWPERSMDGHFKIVAPDGTETISAGLQSAANDLAVKGQVNLGKLIGQAPSGEEKSTSLEDVVMGALQSSGLELAINFSFRTKMDDFQLGPVALNGNMGYSDEGSQGQPGDLKAISEQVEAFGKKYYEEPEGSVVTVPPESEPKEVLAE